MEKRKNRYSHDVSFEKNRNREEKELINSFQNSLNYEINQLIDSGDDEDGSNEVKKSPTSSKKPHRKNIQLSSSVKKPSKRSSKDTQEDEQGSNDDEEGEGFSSQQMNDFSNKLLENQQIGFKLANEIRLLREQLLKEKQEKRILLITNQNLQEQLTVAEHRMEKLEKKEISSSQKLLSVEDSINDEVIRVLLTISLLLDPCYFRLLSFLSPFFLSLLYVVFFFFLSILTLIDSTKENDHRRISKN
jgi:hypothetical protein